MSKPKGCYYLYEKKNCTCQSCIDSKKSADVARSHVIGRFCKDHNHCYKCCLLKHNLQILRHFGGTCSKNRKCVVCYWLTRPGEEFMASYSERSMQRMVKEVYSAMLPPQDGKEAVTPGQRLFSETYSALVQQQKDKDTVSFPYKWIRKIKKVVCG